MVSRVFDKLKKNLIKTDSTDSRYIASVRYDSIVFRCCIISCTNSKRVERKSFFIFQVQNVVRGVFVT